MRTTTFVAHCLFVIALLSCTTIRADGLIRDGAGAITMGRGGVNLGYADNGAIILDNPAGMANIASNSLTEVSLDTVICDLNYRDVDNPHPDHSTNGYPLGTVGYVHRNPDSPWAYGLGVYAPAGFGSGYHLNNPDTGPAFYKSFGALVKVLPAVACQVSERLSVGANFGIGLSYAALEGPFYIQTGPFAGTPTLLDLHTTGVAPIGGVGLQYQVSDNTMLGLSYTEQTRLSLNGNARARLVTPFGPLDSGFESASMRLIWPRSLGLGLMHQFSPWSRGGMDVVWYDWSSAFSELPITLNNPSNPIVGAVLGPQIRDVFPLHWHDTVSFRFGQEWMPTDDFTARVGYVYHRSPVNGATLNPYLDGILTHVATVGMSRRVQNCWVNLAYQFSWSPERTVGTSNIVGGDFSNSSLRAQAHWIALSVMTTY